MIKAAPNSKLRGAILSVMASKGFAGPNYNLDDISAYCSESQGVIYLHFWDMSCYIKKGEKAFDSVYKLIQEQ